MRAVVATGTALNLIGDYIREKTGARLDEGMYQGFAIVNDSGVFTAAVTVSNFRGTDCEMSAASESPAAWRPHILKVVYSYIFNQLGCVRVTCITTKRNSLCRKSLEAMGFQLEGRLRLGYDGKIDALVYGLLASECRYLADFDSEGDLNGEKEQSRSPSGTGPVRDGASPNYDEQGNGGSAGEPEQDRPVHATG